MDSRGEMMHVENNSRRRTGHALGDAIRIYDALVNPMDEQGDPAYPSCGWVR